MSVSSCRLLLPLFFALSLGTGCAGLSHYAEGPEAPGPSEDAARVYFVLAQGFPSGAGYVVEDTDLLGYIGNNQYFYVDVPSGEHQFMLISEQDEAVSGNFEAGKIYHLKVYITPGLFQTRTYWTPLEATGEDAQSRAEDIADCRRVELNPELAAKWEAQHAEDNSSRAQSFKSGEDEATPIESVHGL